MTVNPLNEAASVALNGAGAGTVSMAPHSVSQIWRLSVAAVKVSSAVLEPQCSIYIGSQPIDAFFVDGTFTGSLDSTDSVANFPISRGQKIWAVWSGGDPGAIATLSVLGTYGDS